MPESSRVPNVYGIETEYSCLLTLPGDVIYEIVGTCHSVDAQLGLYVQPKSKGTEHITGVAITKASEEIGLYRTSTGMLSNGARLYIDPSGPEYATPETRTAEEAVHRTFDGDDILLALFGRLRESGVLEGFQVNRRIVDHNRSSRGIHLNTTTSLPAGEKPAEYVRNALFTLNVVKGAIFGSGGLLVNKNGETHFHHSPRLSVTNTTDADFHFFTVRPLVRHPFKAEGDSLARIETITSDALNFGWPLRASLVATNSLIRMLERRPDISLPILRQPIRAAHIVGRYGYENHISIVRENGQNIGEKPLTILRNIGELILSVDATESILDDEAKQVLPEIIDVADRMAVDPESVAAQVESMARLIAMRGKMEKTGAKLNSERMCRFDYAWDWLGGGLAERLRNKNLAGWQGFTQGHRSEGPDAAKKRRNSPPVNTRAKIRGDMIDDYAGEVDVEWDGTEHTYFHPLDTVA
jgi:hypothetical protein